MPGGIEAPPTKGGWASFGGWSTGPVWSLRRPLKVWRSVTVMYLVHLKSMLVSALRQTFDEQYPEQDFRGLHVSIEYPIEPQQYPSIWVDYDDTRPLQSAGINHHEYVGNDEAWRSFTRWRFAGFASFTVVALTSLERDRLYDEMIRVMAFAQDSNAVGQFRSYVENNELIACNFDFDEVEPRGNAAAPGTPWGTDEIVYERTINMQAIGEFISDGTTHALVPLRKILVYPYSPAYGETDTHPDYPNVDPTSANAWQ